MSSPTDMFLEAELAVGIILGEPGLLISENLD